MVGRISPAAMRSVVALFALVLAAVPLPAEIQSSVVSDLSFNIVMSPGQDGEAAVLLPGFGAELNFNSTGNRDVRAYLKIGALPFSPYTLLVDRVWLRTRYEDVRLTLGKTRLSWGEGLVFNAADILLGSSDLNVNLAAQELRSDSQWLASLYFPLGRFSYLETAFLAPDSSAYNPLDPASAPLAADSGYAARLGFELESLGDIAVETGYAFSGDEDKHKAFISLQGGSGLNWHTSASTWLPVSGWDTGQSTTAVLGDRLFDGLLISAGLYALPNIGNDNSLSIRTEALLDPSEDFSASETATEYGIYSFTDISLGLGTVTTIYVRSLLSPVDLSALLYSGVTLALYQGLTIYSDLAIQAGETTDVYSISAPGSVVLRSGVRFIY